jgi:sarcosine oxidase subunit alpha
MVGSGNIGLIVSYQLMQAGVKVKAIVEGLFHRRLQSPRLETETLGRPLLMQHTVKRAIGTDRLEAVELVKLDDRFNEVATHFTMPTKALCVAVGLSPFRSSWHD